MSKFWEPLAPLGERGRGEGRLVLGLALVFLASCRSTPTPPPIQAPPVQKPPVQSGTAQIDFLDVGQGDCIALHANGQTVLVDAAPSKDAGERIVVPRLRALGWEPVSLILLSHPDRDHIAGLPAILKRWPEAQIGISKVFQQAKEFQNLPNVKWLGPAGIFHLGAWQIDVACPPLPPGGKDNDGSMCLRFTDGSAAAVLTGDAPIKTEDWLMGNTDWSHADVFKAGHHGSRTSTGEAILAKLRPDWVIFSCGKGNPYGHPTPQAIDRAKAAGAQVWRTDTQGEAVFVSQNSKFMLQPGAARP
ncbi:ComEC/Rec2 family competence protein [soil metagenome]